MNMDNDDRKLPPPPTETLAPAETPLPTDVLAPPALAAPEALVEGFRRLQQRIPGFTHLSVQEKRSHARAANLDPEFIESGLHAATAWHHTKLYVKRSGEELREEQEEIRRWEQVVVEMRAITDGIEAANTKRKHRLGRAILTIYRMLGSCVERGFPGHLYMRPYYENMRRAFLRTRAFRKRKKPEDPEME
jgi:hypothetical protein